MKKILNMHRRDPNNVGDMNCAPYLYFDFLKDCKTRDLSIPKGEWDAIILGGGGLLYRQRVMPSFDEFQKANPHTKLIYWGVGHNTHDTAEIQLPKLLKKWDLVGARDYDHGFPWVPCVSCMNPLFDQPYNPREEVVAYMHHVEPIPDEFVKNFPLMTNKEKNLSRVLYFLGSAKTIITNTYHGVYWSTLLGKKVLIYEPFSSRFFGLKHPHVMGDRRNWKRKLSATLSYPEALGECRQANLDFSEKVADLIS